MSPDANQNQQNASLKKHNCFKVFHPGCFFSKQNRERKKKEHPKKALGARSTARGGDKLVGRAENTRSEMFSAAALWNSLEADNFQENQINSEVDCRTRRHPGRVSVRTPKEEDKNSQQPFLGFRLFSTTKCLLAHLRLHAALYGFLWRCCNQDVDHDHRNDDEQTHNPK